MNNTFLEISVSLSAVLSAAQKEHQQDKQSMIAHNGHDDISKYWLNLKLVIIS